VCNTFHILLSCPHSFQQYGGTELPGIEETDGPSKKTKAGPSPAEVSVNEYHGIPPICQ
jgi:hypothetical protein